MGLSGNREIFFRGMRDGLPIGLGHFAVAFSLFKAAIDAGLGPAQGFLASFLTNASAGEYAVFKLMAEGGTYAAVLLVTLITNARYLLMSCALSQRLRPGTGMGYRLLMAYDINDEVFGITIAQKGYINPWYTFGAMCTSIPFWATGTALGITMGNLLPTNVVSALSVALFGMFLAVIIPPSRKSPVVAGVVAVSFLCSLGAEYLPVIKDWSSGNRIILLTVIIAGLAAVLFPHPQEDMAEQEEDKAHAE